MFDIFQEAIVISMLAATLRIATPLLLASIGELVVQRTGIWNLGVEGHNAHGDVCRLYDGARVGFTLARCPRRHRSRHLHEHGHGARGHDVQDQPVRDRDWD